MTTRKSQVPRPGTRPRRLKTTKVKTTEKPVATPTTPPTRTRQKVGLPSPLPVGTDRAADRAAAKQLGINLVHYTILRALADGMPRTYRQIQDRTGYYSILTAQLRPSHEGSLGQLGLVKEEVDDIDGKDKLIFSITARGSRLLAKLNR